MTILARASVAALSVLALAAIAGYALYQGMADRSAHGASAACETYENRENRRILPMGATLPMFALNTVDGQPFDLAQTLKTSRAPLALIELFATWCPHCKASVPTLRELQQAYGDRALILAVNAGGPPKPGDLSGAAFRDAYGATYPILEHPDKALIDRLCLTSFPTFYLINHSGRILWRHIGELDADKRRSLENALLGGRSPKG